MNRADQLEGIMVLVPAYNEAPTVAEVVKKAREISSDYHVFVVDDGSNDGTSRLARESGAEVVTLPFHCGGRWAVIIGYRIAILNRYKYLVKVDADGQHKVSDINRLLANLTQGTDVVVGSRYLPSEDNGEVRDSRIKHWGRILSSAVISMTVGMKITDVTSGLRAWRCDVLKDLLDSYDRHGYVEDSVFWLNETILLRKLGKTILEVPVSISLRMHGTSKSFTRLKMLNYPVRVFTTLLRSLFWGG